MLAGHIGGLGVSLSVARQKENKQQTKARKTDMGFTNVGTEMFTFGQWGWEG